MSIRLQIFAILGSLGILAYLIRLIITEKLHFRYALVWIAVFAGTIAGVIFPNAMIAVTAFFGIDLPSNFIIWSVLVLLLIYSVSLTVHLSEMALHLERLTQEVAILRLEAEMNQARDNGGKPVAH